VVVARWPQDRGGDHPGRGGFGAELGGRIVVGDTAESPGRRRGGGLAVKVCRLMLSSFTFNDSLVAGNDLHDGRRCMGGLRMVCQQC